LNILDSIRDPLLFGNWFQARESWAAWRVFLAALFALPIEDEKIYASCTGNRPLPTRQARESFLIVGRRGGKSFICALVAVYLAAFRQYHLSPGERGVCMLLASDRRQARVLIRYVKAFLERVPMLRAMIENETADSIALNNGITIEVHTASFRSVRGYTVVAAICDEIAFWRSDESANPDVEILNALRPAMATIPNSMLLCLSTPYSRRGALWTAYKQHFGKPGDTLIWQSPTRSMNPSVPASVIDAAFEEDSATASAEFGAEFRSDVEAYITQECVDSCVVPGRHELPPVAGTRYVAFCDPSGGSQDAFTLAIGHAEPERAVLDLVRERKPPFSPEAVAQEFSETLKTYGIHEVAGDRYGGEWPRERFLAHGVSYKLSDKTKSEIYQSALPMLNSAKVELLDSKVLRQQLVGLERRTARGGRDSIDHRPGGRDDVANSVAGVLIKCVAVVPITADQFAQGTFSYFGKPDQERSLWSQRPE
jgi:Phage Terminase